jgi:type I restriction enzyme S subunit
MMSSSWRECKLGEVVTRMTSGGTPSTSKSEYYNGNIPWLNTKEIKNCRIFETEKTITKLGLQNSSAKWIDENSVIVAMYGATAGKVAINKIPLTTNQACCNITLDSTQADYNFIYYLLLTSFDRLDNMTSGAAQQNLNVGLISNFDISLPPLEEQKAIAEVLSSLDDKIDLLHRQNQTLEDLAGTLFRQWFIEEAKEEWEEKPLREIALHVKNNINPANFQNKSFLHFSLPTFDEGQKPKQELGSEILSNKYQVIKNSILVSKLNPRTPRIWLMDENIDEENSICSTEFQVLKPKKNIWKGFIYCFLKTQQAIQELAGASSGTSGSHQRVKPEDIFNLTFQCPNIEILQKFDDISSDYWQKIKINQKQIQTLENLRDTLLPKLLSGEMRIKNE